MCQSKITRKVIITNSEGLHARAATLVAEMVRRFEARVKLAKDCEGVEGTDVLQILSLGAAQGEQLMLEATGEDAERVLDALIDLFASNFAENGENSEEAENQP